MCERGSCYVTLLYLCKNQDAVSCLLDCDEDKFVLLDKIVLGISERHVQEGNQSFSIINPVLTDGHMSMPV